MAAPNDENLTYNGFGRGDIAVRKGRLCKIMKIHWETNPPSVTVKMEDDANEVNTEFDRLHRPTDEDMLKMPLGWYCSACTVENGEMDSLKCYLCETPRNFQETLKYPELSPVKLPHEDDGDVPENNSNINDNNDNNTKHQHDENPKQHDQEQDDEDDDFVIVNNADAESADHAENKENDGNNNNNKHKDNELTFLTWNVWFNEELSVLERMHAIGEHIESRQADIVCLQEVTPLILDILQGGAWCKQYQSTVLPNHGYFSDLRYFNVILTKHEFIRDSIQFKPFTNSVMGRHLIVTPIRLKNKGKYTDKIVYAATSHLESPVGTYQGGKKDKYSAERKQQLKYSLDVLDNRQICENNNVIFGGDMNWCKPAKNGNNENDGDMNDHLNAHWIDCYHKLYPNEPGYTYDAKTNGMLAGFLQNRVDRVLYKENGDLKLLDIRIIGREAIPNLRYKKVFNRKGGAEEKMLPVLPSDHYGLCATFALK
mmetsp:Transcript_28537/g.45119  ORF Transcript_28537/g.45119 Transcript_28537/m.45119 type:complete len:484 (+) Transcript_28537:32-1483(+)